MIYIYNKYIYNINIIYNIIIYIYIRIVALFSSRCSHLCPVDEAALLRLLPSMPPQDLATMTAVFKDSAGTRLNHVESEGGTMWLPIKRNSSSKKNWLWGSDFWHHVALFFFRILPSGMNTPAVGCCAERLCGLPLVLGSSAGSAVRFWSKVSLLL